MKNHEDKEENPEMLDEYEFDYRKAKPNRFAAVAESKQTVITLDPDVAEVFKTSEAVNQVLRAIMKAMPNTA